MPTDTVLGQNHLPTVVIRPKAARFAMAQVYLRGATVTKWVNDDGQQLLYLSPSTDFGPGKAIRGGIPVCWPQFSDSGPLPKHGLVRTSDAWQLVDSADSESGDSCRATFRMVWDGTAPEVDAAHPMKDCIMELAYSVTVGTASLETSLRVTNTSPAAKPFSCTGALHTYFAVSDIRNLTIDSPRLASLEYIDQLAADKSKLQPKASLTTIDREVDRVYPGFFLSNESSNDSDIPNEVVLIDQQQPSSSIVITVKEGFADVVVWNAWVDKAKSLVDMPDEDYRRYVCIEPAVIMKPVVLASGESWTGTQVLSSAASKNKGKL